MINHNRYSIIITGLVQGVGFRPTVYKYATEFNLTGIVNNTAAGVFIEVEGPESKLQSFINKLKHHFFYLKLFNTCFFGRMMFKLVYKR
ncbi:MAG: acylphosphatase [Oligoflexia bacterium]|nr:acylphosphatase [Oligoflexia bacterium]